VYGHADAEIAKGLTRYDALRFGGVASEIADQLGQDVSIAAG
jgi:hypothetical protein